MVATLFYVESVPAAGEIVVVDGDEGFHAATVRRIRPGEELALSDGAGTLADCVVDSVGKRSLAARVVQRKTVAPQHPPVTVVQAIPKSERSELAVELATEAGADAVVAWQAERCVARWDGERAEKGMRRWRAVARAAARQSRRAPIPTITGPNSIRRAVGFGRHRGRTGGRHQRGRDQRAHGGRRRGGATGPHGAADLDGRRGGPRCDRRAHLTLALESS